MKFWEDIDCSGITAKCEYVNDQFKVTVFKGEIKKEGSFSPSFTPKFGMDVIDMNESLKIAEELASEIDEILKGKLEQ